MQKSNTNSIDNNITFPADYDGYTYKAILVCDGTDETRAKLKGLVDDLVFPNHSVEIITTYEIRPLKQ